LQPFLATAGGERLALGALPAQHGRISAFRPFDLDLGVSRRHFQVESAGPGFLAVRDLRSTGGTLLNGAALTPDQPQPLAPGDVLQVGAIQLTLGYQFQPARSAAHETVAPAAPIRLAQAGHPLTVGGPASGADFPLPLADGAMDALAACLYPELGGEHWRVLAFGQPSVEVAVNGRPVIDCRLESEDQVAFGPWSFVYRRAEALLQPAASSKGVSLGLAGVSLRISSPDGPRTILHEVTLALRPGVLTCLIGPSGCGKSTLLRILAGHLQPTSGSLLYQEAPVAPGEWRARLAGGVGLVPQDDIVHQELTVRQSLEYAAALRLPRSTGGADRRERVDRVLRDLELEPHAGKSITQLSGGQRKRVNVAIELISSPPILLLDEPTTGLDTASERSLVDCLKRLAGQGRTVLFITHSLAAAERAESLVFMAADSAGGRIIAQGSPEALKQQHRLADLAQLFTRTAAPAVEPPAHLSADRARGLPCPSKTVALLFRYAQIWMAAPWSTVLTLAGLPLLLGILICVSAPHDSGDRVLFGLICALWLGMNQSVREIVKERGILLRELAGAVRASSYLVSKVAFFLGVGLLQAALLSFPLVWLKVEGWSVSIDKSDLPCSWLLLVFGVWSGLAAGACLGLLVSALCLFLRGKGEVVSVLLVVLIMLPQILFCDKIMSGHVAGPEVADNSSFVLRNETHPLAEAASFATASRYLFLPLKTAVLIKDGFWPIAMFNYVILYLALGISLILTWLTLEIFVYRQTRQIEK
jgi:ABC-type multidrug transport system ATPase subunit